MKIYIGRPPKPGDPEKFVLGEQVIRPTDEQYKKLGFDRPMRRLVKMLSEQNHVPAKMIGAEVTGISVTILLDPNE